MHIELKSPLLQYCGFSHPTCHRIGPSINKHITYANMVLKNAWGYDKEGYET
jgi:hypothetical protein